MNNINISYKMTSENPNGRTHAVTIYDGQDSIRTYVVRNEDGTYSLEQGEVNDEQSYPDFATALRTAHTTAYAEAVTHVENMQDLEAANA